MISKMVEGLELVWESKEHVKQNENHSKCSNQEKRTTCTFSDDPLFGEFSSWMKQKSILHLRSNQNVQNFLVNGRQPVI